MLAWTCDKYEGYLSTQKTSELCTVDLTVLGFLTSDFEASRKLAEFLRKLVPQTSDNVFSLGKVEDQGFSGVPIHRVFSMGPARVDHGDDGSHPPELPALDLRSPRRLLQGK